MAKTSTTNPDAKPLFGVNQLHQKHPKTAQVISKALSNSAIVAHSVVAGMPMAALGLMKLVGQKSPTLKPMGDKADRGIIAIADNWIAINNWLIDHLLPSKDWRIKLPENLDINKRYLLVCNHQSWVDTSIIQYVSQGRLPLTRFFAKYELIYIPIVGQTFYLLDFPMMKRHSKDAIAKNPKLAGRDLVEAARACQLLEDKPFVLLNYLEGTRFSQVKHQAQNSPYRHLLKPKAGGLALAIASLGDKIDGILDMTIVYPDGVPDYNDLWAGKLQRLAVDIRPVEMTDELFESLKQGRYADDVAIKVQLHDWLDELWQQKDRQIELMMSQWAKEENYDQP